MKQQVFDFLVTRYSEEHFWFPTLPKEDPIWEEIVFEDISLELSFALMASDRVVGAASAGVTEDSELSMIWGYISRQYSKNTAVALLKYLLAHQLKVARDRGLCKAEVEIDTTDEVYHALLTWLPISSHKIWRIYQKSVVTT